MSDVLVVGISVVDFVFGMDELPKTATKYHANEAKIVGGGIAANAAVAIRRLGGKARLVSRLGDDYIGDLILKDIVDEGVNIDYIHRTKGGLSPYSAVIVDHEGERQIVNFRGKGLTNQTDWLKKLSPAKAVLVDTRWDLGAKYALHLAKKWGVPGVIDAEPPMGIDLLQCASHVAFSRDGLLYFIASNAHHNAYHSDKKGRGKKGEDSLTTDTPATADHTHYDLRLCLKQAHELLNQNKTSFVKIFVTDGADGAYMIDGEDIIHVSGYKVPVKDTLGAGDVWHGAFAYALADGFEDVDAMRFANATAALKCGTFGGRAGCPHRDEVENLIKGEK